VFVRNKKIERGVYEYTVVREESQTKKRKTSLPRSSSEEFGSNQFFERNARLVKNQLFGVCVLLTEMSIDSWLFPSFLGDPPDDQEDWDKDYSRHNSDDSSQLNADQIEEFANKPFGPREEFPQKHSQ